MPYLDANYELPFQSGSSTSRDAALQAVRFVGPQGLDVYEWIQRCGAYGATQKEISAALRIGRASVCARVHALEKQGRVVKTETRRDGCAVYRVTR